MRRVRYTNPLDGGPVMFSLDCYLIELDAGVETTPFRTSANAVACVIDGEGSSQIGEEKFAWGPLDVFSLPRNNWIAHKAHGKARMFVATDRDVLRRLDLLTEEWGS